jgi:hypothetical protein
MNGSHIYLFPFFLLGLSLSRFSLLKNSNKFWEWVILISLLILLSVFEASGKRSIYGLVVGLTVCVSLIITRIRILILYGLGIYSYGIYLLHVFFTASSRIFLYKVGIDNKIVTLLIGVTLGLLGPIFLEMLVENNSLLSLCFFWENFETEYR